MKESLKYLKDFIDNNPEIGDYNTRIIKKAIEALEKRVPKKIEYTSYGYPNCPVCEAELDGCNYYSYYPYCGQAINWDDIGYME